MVVAQRPDRHRRHPVGLVGDRAIPEQPSPLWSSASIDQQHDRRHRERRRSSASRPRSDSEQRHQRQRAELGEPGDRQQASPRTPEPRAPPAVQATRRPPARRWSSCSGSRAVNGLAAQANANSTPIRGDHSRQPATNSPATARMSNAEAATCAAGQRVPAAAPAERLRPRGRRPGRRPARRCRRFRPATRSGGRTARSRSGRRWRSGRRRAVPGRLGHVAVRASCRGAAGRRPRRWRSRRR